MGTCSYLTSSRIFLIPYRLLAEKEVHPGDSVALLHEVIFFSDLANQRKDSRGELKEDKTKTRKSQAVTCLLRDNIQSIIEGIWKIFIANIHDFVGGTVASWLVHSTPERGVRVRALARDFVLCSWARHFTLTVPLSSQVYKWVPALSKL